jgi:hypothetical protein
MVKIPKIIKNLIGLEMANLSIFFEKNDLRPLGINKLKFNRSLKRKKQR